MYVFIKNNLLFILIVGLYIILGIFTIGSTPRVFIDEPWFTDYVYKSITETQLSPFMPIGRGSEVSPKIFTYIISVIVKYFGYNVFSVRLLSYISFLFSLPFLYSFLNNKLNNSVSLWVTGLYGLQLPVFFSSHIVRNEIFIMLLFFISLWATIKKDTWFKNIIIGIICGSSMFFHFTGQAFTVLIGLVLLSEYRRARLPYKEIFIKCMMFCLGVIISTALYIITNWDGFINSLSIGSHHRVGVFSYIYGFFVNYYYYLRSIYSWKLVVLVIAIINSIILIKNKKREFLSYILPFIVFSLIFFILLALIGRQSKLYIIYFEPFLLGFIITNVHFLFKAKLKNTIYILIVLLSILQITNEVLIGTRIQKEKISTISEVKKSIPKHAVIVGRCQNHFDFTDSFDYIFEWDFWVSYYFNKKNNSKNHYSISDYYKEHPFSYLIMDEEFFKFDSKFLDNSLTVFIKSHCIPIKSIDTYYAGNRLFDAFKYIQRAGFASYKPDKSTIIIYQVINPPK